LALDSYGLQEAFSTYLTQYTYDEHIEEDKYYQTLFESAMLMANQPFQPQEHTAHRRIDVHLTGQGDDEYIIELKLYREEKSKSGPLVPPKTDEEIAELQGQIASLTREALNQIEVKYADKYEGGSGRLIKVALVIARRTLVLAQFEVFGGSAQS
jgi:hypothetical protein